MTLKGNRPYRNYCSKEEKALNEKIIALYNDPEFYTYDMICDQLGLRNKDLIARVVWLVNHNQLKYRGKRPKGVNKKRAPKYEKKPVVELEEGLKERNCLSCSALFVSSGPYNKLCNHCRLTIQETAFTYQ